MNITLVINQSVKCKKLEDIQFNLENEYLKGYKCSSFAKNLGKNIARQYTKSTT